MSAPLPARFGRQTLHFNGSDISGSEPFDVWELRADQPFDVAALRARLQGARVAFPDGGALGFWSYEALRSLEPRSIPHPRADDLGLPLARLVFYQKLERRKQLFKRYRRPPIKPVEVPDFPKARDFYYAGVERIKNYIAAGDIYQANLTYKFSIETKYKAAKLNERLFFFNGHHALRGALLEWRDFAIVSDSPETFLTLNNGVLEARPIKGTVGRGWCPADDEARKAQLLNSAKDRAENVMIVDLMRNDLGRVCEWGSVCVPQLYQIETFPTLHHGVSRVRGKLRADCDGLDAFIAAFPCGSITGAPKIRAMQIINELESEPRGAAMGAIGYFGFDGNMEWSVAIRTATLVGGRAHFNVGGGIVADSEATSEYDEMRLKARALWTVLMGQ